LESMEDMALGESAIRQCACVISKLAPYMIKPCLIYSVMGVERIILLMLAMVPIVLVR